MDAKNDKGKGKDCDGSAYLGSDEEENTLSFYELVPLQSSVMSKRILEDGYFWLRYGRPRQIKSIATSYYRCIHSNCKARKKIIHSDNGDIIKYFYRGQHNHPISQLNSIVSGDWVQQAPHNFAKWCDLIRIELIDTKLCELPESPDCPKLKVLLLRGNVDLMDIPHSFFNYMPLLQHLDLSHTSIRDLPPSVSKLIQLNKFHLRGCDLFVELPPQIGQLKNLQEFDLDGTLITHLPTEVGELINLQTLTLCFDRCHHVLGYANQISNSTIIPPGVMSNLTQLNYLSIDIDPEDERWNENANSVLVEIFGLERLKKVNIYVPKAELLELIPAKTSLSFRLIVGHYKQRFLSRVTPEVEKKFKLCDCSMKFVNGVNIPDGMKMIIRRLKALYLDRHMTMKSLSDFKLINLRRLQACILAECNAMETVVDGSESYDTRVLANLKSLVIFYMKNLRSICDGSNPSFLFLKSLALHTCPMITTIFTLDSLNNFPFLEEVIIEDCPKVTTLISHHSPEPTSVLHLPNLKTISLLYLPELVNICNGLHVGPNLEKIVFYYCPKLQSFSKSELSSTSLKVIKGERLWWEALKWSAAEWGDAGRPKLLEQVFSPIDETDLMKQLAANQETQISTSQHEFRRKRNISVTFEDPHPQFQTSRADKKSHTFGKLAQTVWCVDASQFSEIVQRYTCQSSGERTSYSSENDIIQMSEESTPFNKEDDMEEIIVD